MPFRVLTRSVSEGLFVKSKFADMAFWVDSFDRAFASFAQAMIAGGVLESAGVVAVDWVGVLSLAGGYALTSLLSSVAFRGNVSE